MPRSYLSYGFLLSFLASIFALQWRQEPSYPPFLWIALSGIAGTAAFLCIPKRTRMAGGMGIASVLGIALALFTVARTTHVPGPETVDTYASKQSVILHGFIVDDPDRRPLRTHYTVEAAHIVLDEREIPVRGRMRLSHLFGWPEFSYGDEILASGILEKPEPFEDFAYDRYLSRFGIFSIMQRAEIEKISGGHGYRIFAFLYDIKRTFERQIQKTIPEPHASLLSGLLTGSRRGLPEELLVDFNRTGLSHIIAISGQNITIVISCIGLLLFFVPLHLRIIPLLLAITAFVFIVGAGASVVRAAIMGLLGAFALGSGRIPETRLLILWTLFFMLAWNPMYLWYDAGFQLSFLAVVGIAEIAVPLKGKISLPPVFGEAILATVAAQITTAPLLMVLFGSFSLIAPFANALVALVIPSAMLLGFLGTIVGFVSFPLGQLVSFLAFGCLAFIVRTAEILSAVPYASIPVPAFGKWFLPSSYAILFGLLIFWQYARRSLR